MGSFIAIEVYRKNSSSNKHLETFRVNFGAYTPRDNLFSMHAKLSVKLTFLTS